jgi:uncharacterized protein YuzE
VNPILNDNGDCWYLVLGSNKVEKTIEVSPNLFFDLDKEGNLLGIEGLGPIQFEPALQAFARIVDQQEFLDSLPEEEQ